ncbi:AtzH-like domain-containing protein [Nocardia macrotermitis]|uniref:Glutamyl-tRNA(Gln) amidotransferase subunit A n=1 Tax=Nocardia macrotermitis TaxID=2585198 RepID=A0A7K0CY65_9NOCA|nr:AtzH-like domain-containing protein [Nocardia macrotermitis]MQY18381.1 Glutamyl-tRNA(Gln) amidotransferase subunit A [Nocardia macrotermitis]
MSYPDDFDSGLRAAFLRYERALMRNDLVELDALFAAGERPIRSDPAVTLAGHRAISEFRSGRGGAPPRELVRVHVRNLGPDRAAVVAETRRGDGARGIQTQVWERSGDGVWAIAVAHVSASAATDPSLPIASDVGVWRVLPEVEASLIGEGQLGHARVAVKDLFAVAGYAVGAGNPTWLAEAAIEVEHADAVAALLGAGANVVGIAATDELAFSLSGVNGHYGVTPNPVAPQRICGGSSSGPAAAVAGGLADIGLGTDTAGSIRVPASYCGLYGLRTTHGAVSLGGVVGLAPSFDSVGLLTRDPELLARAAAALLPGQRSVPIRTILVAPQLSELLEPDAHQSFTAAVQALTMRHAASGGELPAPRPTELPLPEGIGIDEALGAFRTVQLAEAWRMHGNFVEAHPDALTPDVAARFRAGRDIDAATEAVARQLISEIRKGWHDLLQPGVALALPSASTAAPRIDTDPEQMEIVRQATLRLTCHASLAGLPALSIPHAQSGDLPVGVCLLAGPHQDTSLTEFVAKPLVEQD